ncbi:hypothetical protein GDO86_018772 [Hymenochirus boettgeri]|uniref:C2H2-type domain-containing protein n=1 Tax=Hymenochirus boettgeri TaxID=247094 RepID=A0A8T2IFL3_9PIPI|nr:hypothetical protein GDO86_018772 [Hymenochirus boettgeri]
MEEWEYLKGKKTPYRKAKKKKSSVDCDYEDNSDTKPNLETNLCCENKPSEIVDEEPEENFPNGDISPTDKETVTSCISNGIKEEMESWEGECSDCTINPLTEQIQGTDPSTDSMESNLNSLSTDYISFKIKEEPDSWEEDSDYNMNPLTEQSQETDPSTPNTGSNLNEDLPEGCIAIKIKEEMDYWEGEYSDSNADPQNEQIKRNSDNDVAQSNSLTLKKYSQDGESFDEAKCTSDVGISTLQTFCSEGAKIIMESPIVIEHKKTNPKCGKGFRSRTELSFHQSVHTGKKPFSCSECGKCFSRSSKLTAHKKTHTGERPFSCSVCGKSFLEKSHLNRHNQIHTGEKPFSCSECGKCFSGLTHFMTHQRIHTGEKPFQCLECGKYFRSRSDLSSHQSVHTGTKPFSCSECGKCFARKSKLNIHQRLHTGEKPFPCTICGKSFLERSHLNTHQQIHTGEKPFSCADCGKSFARSSQLTAHQRTHPGEKPFSCSDCGKCFPQSYLLTSHQRIHTDCDYEDNSDTNLILEQFVL